MESVRHIESVRGTRIDLDGCGVLLQCLPVKCDQPDLAVTDPGVIV